MWTSTISNLASEPSRRDHAFAEMRTGRWSAPKRVLMENAMRSRETSNSGGNTCCAVLRSSSKSPEGVMYTISSFHLKVRRSAAAACGSRARTFCFGGCTWGERDRREVAMFDGLEQKVWLRGKTFLPALYISSSGSSSQERLFFESLCDRDACWRRERAGIALCTGLLRGLSPHPSCSPCK